MRITQKGNHAMFAFVSGSIFGGAIIGMFIWLAISLGGWPAWWRIILTAVIWLVVSIFIGSLFAGGVVEDEEKEKVRRMLNDY